MRRWTIVGGAAILLSIGLRIDYALRFPPEYTWDITHLNYARFVAQHGRLPLENEDPSIWGNMYYHTPLFYLVSAAIGGREVGYSALKSVNVVCGFLRLAVLSIGLFILFPRQRRAVALSLVLFAIVPLNAQVDAAISNEPMSATLALISVLACLWAERANTAALGRIGASLAGVFASLAMLSKISGGVALGAPAIAFVVRPSKERLIRALIATALFILVASPYFALNISRYGRPFTNSNISQQAEFRKWKQEHSLSEYRPISWFIMPPTPELLAHPHYPNARSFWGNIYVWLWADYEGHLSRRHDRGHGTVEIFDKRVDARGFEAGRRILYAAVPLSALVTLALLMAIVQVLRRKEPLAPEVDLPIAAAVLLPILAYTAFLMGYGWLYPFDQNGVVKGVYIFGAIPLVCMVGGFAYSAWWTGSIAKRAVLAATLIAPTACVLVYRIVW